MVRGPDTPCVDCGKLTWTGRGSLPPGQRRCRDCRRANPQHKRPRPYPQRTCEYCSTQYWPNGPRQRTCSAQCGALLRYSSNPRLTVEQRRASWRRKNHARRTKLRMTDVTPEYELRLRARAKRCPLCDVKLIDKAKQPESKELDHIVPINVGGTHTIGNVRIICRLCNSRRPKDGSDYAGQLTLWSQEPGIVTKPKPKRPTKPGPPRCPTCGGPPGTGQRAHICEPASERGRKAAELRATGMRWVDVATQAGFTSPGSAYLCAKRYGDPKLIDCWP